MTSRLLATVWAITLVIGVSGAHRVLGAPPGPSTGDVRALEREIVSLRRQHAVDGVEIERLRQEVARLKAALAEAENRADEARRGGGIVEAAPTPVTPPAAAIPAPVESGDLVDEELPPVDVVRTPPPGAPPPADASPDIPAPGAPQPGAPQPGAPRPGTPDASGQAVYDAGYTFFHQRQFEDAEARFLEFLAAYPNGELSDNAQFWIGECRYARGDYQGALEAFTTTVERHPNGNKVPDAMLQAGKALEALGDDSGAAETYREVIARFPATAAAAIAEERLESLQ